MPFSGAQHRVNSLFFLRIVRQQIVLDREECRRRPCGHTDFIVYMLDMMVGSFGRDRQLIGDLTGR